MSATSDSSAALERLKRAAAAPVRAAESQPAREPAPQTEGAGHHSEAAAPRAGTPRRALGSAKELSRRQLRAQRAYLAGERATPVHITKARKSSRRSASTDPASAGPVQTDRTDGPAALDTGTATGAGAGAGDRPGADTGTDAEHTAGAEATRRRRRGLSELLDALGSPSAGPLAKPLDATATALFAPLSDPERRAAAAERRRAAEERAHRRAEQRRARAAEVARARAEELSQIEESAARREAELEHARLRAAEERAADEEEQRELARAAQAERREELAIGADARARYAERARAEALARQEQAEQERLVAEEQGLPPREPRPRRGLSDVLDSLGSPNVPIERIAAPLAAPVARLIPQETDPEKLAEQEAKRAAAEAKRHEEAERRRREATETARARAAELARLEAEAAARAEREESSRHEALAARRQREAERRERAAADERRRREATARAARVAAQEQAAALAAAERAQQHAEAEAARIAAAEAQRRAQDTQAWIDEQERLRTAARVAAQRKAELKRRRAQEVQRRRRQQTEDKQRAATAAQQRKSAEEARRQREAEAAAERARIQAERREREARAQEERERQRAEAAVAAERRREQERLAAERARAEAERRAVAQREAQTLAARRFTRRHAAAGLRQAQFWEDRVLAAEEAVRERAADAFRAHQDRETWALRMAARQLDGSLSIPAPQERRLLAQPEEQVSDEELVQRALAYLPAWRHNNRLANKARAMENAARRARVGSTSADGSRGTGAAGGANAAGASAAGAAGSGAGAGAAVGPATGEIRQPVPSDGTGPEDHVEVEGPLTRADRARQVFVTLAAGVFVLAGIWGLGIFGRVPGLSAVDAGSYWAAHAGRYQASSMVLAPFFLHALTWPLLWSGAVAYALHQWGPRQAIASRQRTTGWLAGSALLLLAAWFPVAIFLPFGVEAFAWIAAAACLFPVIHHLNLAPPRNRAEDWCTDGFLGALVGFVLVFGLTTVSAAFHAWGLRIPGVPGAVWSMLAVIAVVVLGARLALTERGRMSIALVMGLSLFWLAVPRLLPAPLGVLQSELVGLPAIFGAFAVVLLVGTRRYRIHQEEQRALLR
ncbi:MAG: hypothetical protein Q4G34_04710 [Micrococcus sp.]|nr:hypothetical protein [Micrococcus sp.]